MPHLSSYISDTAHPTLETLDPYAVDALAAPFTKEILKDIKLLPAGKISSPCGFTGCFYKSLCADLTSMLTTTFIAIQLIVTSLIKPKKPISLSFSSQIRVRPMLQL